MMDEMGVSGFSLISFVLILYIQHDTTAFNMNLDSRINIMHSSYILVHIRL